MYLTISFGANHKYEEILNYFNKIISFSHPHGLRFPFFKDHKFHGNVFNKNS